MPLLKTKTGYEVEGEEVCMAGNPNIRILVQHIAQAYVGKGSYAPVFPIILGEGGAQAEILWLYLDKTTAGIGRISINVVGIFTTGDIDGGAKSDSQAIAKPITSEDNGIVETIMFPFLRTGASPS